MIYLRLADAVVIVHLLFVLFVVGGGWLAVRWPRLIWVHLPAAIWGAAIEFAGWICPLTPLENWLRHRGGELGYTGGFVQHYLLPALYPASLDRPMQWFLGGAVLLINALAYWRLWRLRHDQRPRRPERHAP